MIHHISIAVENTLHVANVLAQIWNGKVFPFPPTEGSYIMIAFDSHGTAIEIYPQGTTFLPTNLHLENGDDANTPSSVPFHAAISVSADVAHIKQVAQGEGWRVQVCDRGFFKVVEVWIENRQLLELLPPDFVPAYLTLFNEAQSVEKAMSVAVHKLITIKPESNTIQNSIISDKNSTWNLYLSNVLNSQIDLSESDVDQSVEIQEKSITKRTRAYWWI